MRHSPPESPTGETASQHHEPKPRWRSSPPPSESAYLSPKGDNIDRFRTKPANARVASPTSEDVSSRMTQLPPHATPRLLADMASCSVARDVLRSSGHSR
jgi:hypothetical protein